METERHIVGKKSETFARAIAALCMAFIIATAAAAACRAAESDTGTMVLQLDEVVVEESELDRQEQVPDMSVVKPDLFPKSIGTSLDTALERQPGVDVQRIQEVGTAVDDDSVKLRGFGARRIVAAVDGRTMNTSGVAGGYFIDWTMIPLANVDHLEIIKGVGDPRFGNVLGGVVNLVTKDPPTDKPDTELEFSGGSFDTFSSSMYHAWTMGNLEYSLSLSHSESEGYLRNSSYNFNGGGLYMGYTLPNDDKVTMDLTFTELHKGFIVANRATSTYGITGYNTSADGVHPAADGEFLYGGSAKRAAPKDGSWWEKERRLLDVGFVRLINDASDMELHFWTRNGTRETFNDNQDGSIFHKIYEDDSSFGFTAEYNYSLRNHELGTGYEMSDLGDNGSETGVGDTRGSRSWGYYVAARNESLYVMDEISVSSRLKVTPALRYMSYKGKSGPEGRVELIPDISMKGWAPSVKLVYGFNDKSTGYMTLARALRMPTAPEHYWHYDPDDAGIDTSALPFDEEDGIMIQGGWKYDNRARGLVIDISPYYYVIDDYIQFDLINFIAYNIDEAKFYGLEFEVTKQFGAGWSSFFNYTYQKSSTTGDQVIANFINPADSGYNEVPGLPEHKANWGLQYKTKRGSELAAFATYVSDQDVLYSNNKLSPSANDFRIRTQDSFVRVDLEAGIPLCDHSKLGLFARNIFDENYDERLGFPAAERNYGASLTIDF